MASVSVHIASALNHSHTLSMLIKLLTILFCSVQLALEHGRQTAELVPPHKFVPWVVVDGKPLYNVSGRQLFLKFLIKTIMDVFSFLLAACSVSCLNFIIYAHCSS